MSVLGKMPLAQVGAFVKLQMLQKEEDMAQKATPQPKPKTSNKSTQWISNLFTFFLWTFKMPNLFQEEKAKAAAKSSDAGSS